jgi:uncharacterized protein
VRCHDDSRSRAEWSDHLSNGPYLRRRGGATHVAPGRLVATVRARAYARGVRLLSIDGGGIRGVIPAMVLEEIEGRTGRRVHELFDLIAGTSTGGIIACALTRPQPMTAADVVALYIEEGPRIFHRDLLKRITSVGGWIDERYDDDGLNAALREHLGDARLRDALTPILVTAYDLERRAAVFFRSARSDRDVAMWEVARATSAAPTYFEPWRVSGAALVDGGVFAVNPAMCAYADVAPDAAIDVLASLGTGSKSSDHAIPYDQARGWGQLGWARPILDVVFDGVADTVEFEVSKLLPADAYVRLQTQLQDASGALDDASAKNLRDLQAEARRLIAERAADIDALCEKVAT